MKKGKKVLRPGGFGRLANIDECYPAFLSWGLISGNDKPSAGVNTHTSILNRFLQSGSTSRITRTAGAYGGVAAKPVSFALLGNCHPTTALQMLTGGTGVHVAAAHDRLLFYTCPRIQPHEPLPQSVQVVGPRFFWSDLPTELADLSGLAPLLHDPEMAAHSGQMCSVLICCICLMTRLGHLLPRLLCPHGSSRHIVVAKVFIFESITFWPQNMNLLLVHPTLETSIPKTVTSTQTDYTIITAYTYGEASISFKFPFGKLIRRMLQRTACDLRRVLLAEDPAGLLSEECLDFVTAALAEETEVEIRHADRCPTCASTMTRHHTCPCHILTAQGLVTAKHVAMRCLAKGCANRRKFVWSNFLAKNKGDHVWTGGSQRQDVAMVTPHFGVTWQWQKQFSRRILHHRASFQGESLVHDLAAAGLEHGNERIAEAWCKLQLLNKCLASQDVLT